MDPDRPRDGDGEQVGAASSPAADPNGGPANDPQTTLPPRRTPTAAEARALGHPLRLRIVFACRDRARTNKELARALDTTPGTIHYHLKLLLQQGFLVPEAPRRGARGSREQPYRTTGRSWQLGYSAPGAAALRRAVADELVAGPEADVLELTRLGLGLGPSDRDELLERLHELAQEFAGRSSTPPGEAPRPAVEGEEQLTLVLGLLRPSTPEPAEDR